MGKEGVSLAFSLGMLKVSEDLNGLRKDLWALAEAVVKDPYVSSAPSVKKRIAKGPFFFHAKDDLPEVREKMFKFIVQRDLSLETCFARKELPRFQNKHHGDEAEFYADVLGHLIKNKLEMGRRLVLNIAHRGNSTGNKNLERALAKAVGHLERRKVGAAVTSKVVFNVTTPVQEPILWIADYLCWAVQRVLERGETRHYDFVKDQIAMACDLYDTGSYAGSRNYYGRQRPLTVANKLSPPTL